MTESKLVFSLVDNLESTLKARSLNKSTYPVIVVKTDAKQSVPAGIVDFFGVIDPTGKFLYINCILHKLTTLSLNLQASISAVWDPKLTQSTTFAYFHFLRAHLDCQKVSCCPTITLLLT